MKRGTVCLLKNPQARRSAKDKGSRTKKRQKAIQGKKKKRRDSLDKRSTDYLSETGLEETNFPLKVSVGACGEKGNKWELRSRKASSPGTPLFECWGGCVFTKEPGKGRGGEQLQISSGVFSILAFAYAKRGGTDIWGGWDQRTSGGKRTGFQEGSYLDQSEKKRGTAH